MLRQVVMRVIKSENPVLVNEFNARTNATATTAMISAYSITWAPDSSRANARMDCLIEVKTEFI